MKSITNLEFVKSCSPKGKNGKRVKKTIKCKI